MYEYREEVSELARQLKKFKKVGVISHVRPDGDAIGSQLALCRWLEAQGVTFLAHNDDSPPDDISWIAKGIEIAKRSESELDACDAFLFVDGNSPGRFGQHHTYFEKSTKPSFVIDHHPSPSEGYSYLVSVPEAASTAELVFLMYRETAPDAITKEIAAALYAGIMTDTGSFRYSSVGSHTHEIIAQLIEAGGLQVNQIHERVYDNRGLNQLRLISRVLGQIEIHEYGIATMYVRTTDFEATNCSYEHTEGLIGFALSVKGVTSAVIFTEYKGQVKMSLRSKSNLDVNQLARKFGGGGHQKAAGAWHDGPLEKAMREVIDAAKQMYVQAEAGAAL